MVREILCRVQTGRPPFTTAYPLTCIGFARRREAILPFWVGFRRKKEWTEQLKLPSKSRFHLRSLPRWIGWIGIILSLWSSRCYAIRWWSLSARLGTGKRKISWATPMPYFFRLNGRSHLGSSLLWLLPVDHLRLVLCVWVVCGV